MLDQSGRNRECTVDPTEKQTKIAVDYVTHLANGGIDERHLADDMEAWSLTMRRVPRSCYWPRLRNVKAIFTTALQWTIDSTLAVPGRVVVQARSHGVLYTGDEYSNHYLFLIEFNEQDQIRHAREYFDVQRLREILMPALLKYEEENSCGPPAG